MSRNPAREQFREYSQPVVRNPQVQRAACLLVSSGQAYHKDNVGWYSIPEIKE
jgi:hypothetical protein